MVLLLIAALGTIAALLWADPAVSEPIASKVMDGPRAALRVNAYLGDHRLHSDPVLHDRDLVRLDAYGFDAGERVLVRRLSEAALAQVIVADRRGVARYVFRIGQVRLQTDVVTMVGLAPGGPGAGQGNVAVQVPHASIFPFRPRH